MLSRWVYLDSPALVMLAYIIMQRWLGNFACRIELDPLVSFAAGVLTLNVALVAMGAQVLQAARASPAQTLKDE